MSVSEHLNIDIRNKTAQCSYRKINYGDDAELARRRIIVQLKTYHKAFFIPFYTAADYQGIQLIIHFNFIHIYIAILISLERHKTSWFQLSLTL